MAKSKSDRIREYLEANPSAKPLAVAAALGGDITAQYVSTVRFNLKKAGKLKVAKQGGKPKGPKRVLKTRVTRKKSATTQTNAQGVLEGLASLAKTHSWQPLDDLGALVDTHGWENVKKAYEVVKEVQKGLQ